MPIFDSEPYPRSVVTTPAVHRHTEEMVTTLTVVYTANLYKLCAVEFARFTGRCVVSTLLTPGECDKITVAVHVITIVIVSCILRTAGLLILLTQKANRSNAQSNVVQGQNC